MLSFEEFIKKIKKYGGVIDEEVNPIPGEFQRTAKIKSVNGTEIVFEWYKNLMNAYINDILICWFDNFELITTFPNNYKENIAIFQGSNKVAIIPIMEYPK